MNNYLNFSWLTIGRKNFKKNWIRLGITKQSSFFLYWWISTICMCLWGYVSGGWVASPLISIEAKRTRDGSGLKIFDLGWVEHLWVLKISPKYPTFFYLRVKKNLIGLGSWSSIPQTVQNLWLPGLFLINNLQKMITWPKTNLKFCPFSPVLLSKDNRKLMIFGTFQTKKDKNLNDQFLIWARGNLLFCCIFFGQNIISFDSFLHSSIIISHWKIQASWTRMLCPERWAWCTTSKEARSIRD